MEHDSKRAGQHTYLAGRKIPQSLSPDVDGWDVAAPAASEYQRE